MIPFRPSTLYNLPLCFPRTLLLDMKRESIFCIIIVIAQFHGRRACALCDGHKEGDRAVSAWLV
jgi:hypothetical protein